DLRIPGANEIAVLIANPFEARVDLAAAAAAGDDVIELLFGGGADAQPHAVVGEDVQLVDVVDGLAGHQAVDAAGVIADHAADGAVGVGGGVGAEGEGVLLRGVAQIVENYARLYSCIFIESI